MFCNSLKAWNFQGNLLFHKSWYKVPGCFVFLGVFKTMGRTDTTNSLFCPAHAEDRISSLQNYQCEKQASSKFHILKTLPANFKFQITLSFPCGCLRGSCMTRDQFQCHFMASDCFYSTDGSFREYNFTSYVSNDLFLALIPTSLLSYIVFFFSRLNSIKKDIEIIEKTSQK